MLSATNEINDIKKEVGEYVPNGYNTDAEFNIVLTNIIETAKNENMIPVIGESDYDALEELDSTGTYEQKMAYRAEVMFACAEYMFYKDRKDKFNRQGTSESRGAMGGETTSMTGFSGKSENANRYIARGNALLAIAGYEPFNKLTPRSSVHAN